MRISSWSSIIFITPLLGYCLILVVCILISLRTGDLFFQWVSLEVNILSVIPLLVVKIREDSVLNGLKYFISQSVASLIFILCVLIGGASRVTVGVVCLAVLFKIGLPPLHSWLLSILPTVGYIEMFILLRVQKFIPLIILRQIALPIAVLGLIIVSCLIFLMLSLNKVGSIFMLIFLSSRRNGLWVLNSLVAGRKWLLFIMVYTVIIGAGLLMLNVLKVFKINDVLYRSYMGAICIRLQFLNIGGLPPFMGFLLKVLIIKVILGYSWFMVMILIILSLIIIYLYTTILYQAYCATNSYNFNINSTIRRYRAAVWLVRILGSGLIIYLI